MAMLDKGARGKAPAPYLSLVPKPPMSANHLSARALTPRQPLAVTPPRHAATVPQSMDNTSPTGLTVGSLALNDSTELCLRDLEALSDTPELSGTRMRHRSVNASPARAVPHAMADAASMAVAASQPSTLANDWLLHGSEADAITDAGLHGEAGITAVVKRGARRTVSQAQHPGAQSRWSSVVTAWRARFNEWHWQNLLRSRVAWTLAAVLISLALASATFFTLRWQQQAPVALPVSVVRLPLTEQAVIVTASPAVVTEYALPPVVIQVPVAQPTPKRVLRKKRAWKRKKKKSWRAAAKPAKAATRSKGQARAATASVWPPVQQTKQSKAPVPSKAKVTQPAVTVAATSDLPDRPSRAQTMRALRSIQAPMRRCAPNHRGAVVPIRITATGNGQIQTVRVAGQLAGTSESQCIANAVRRAKLPPFRQAKAVVDFPFLL